MCYALPARGKNSHHLAQPHLSLCLHSGPCCGQRAAAITGQGREGEVGQKEGCKEVEEVGRCWEVALPVSQGSIEVPAHPYQFNRTSPTNRFKDKLFKNFKMAGAEQ